MLIFLTEETSEASEQVGRAERSLFRVASTKKKETLMQEIIAFKLLKPNSA